MPNNSIKRTINTPRKKPRVQRSIQAPKFLVRQPRTVDPWREIEAAHLRLMNLVRRTRR